MADDEEKLLYDDDDYQEHEDLHTDAAEVGVNGDAADAGVDASKDDGGAPQPGPGPGSGNQGSSHGKARHGSGHSKDGRQAQAGSVRYFIIRSNSVQNIYISVRVGAWATGRQNDDKLNSAFRSAQQVRLLYSVNGSNAFQGYAVMKTLTGKFGKPVTWENGRQFGNPFGVEWKVLYDLPHAECEHIRNPLNDGKPIHIARDGTEVPAEQGDQLVRLMEERAAAAGAKPPRQQLQLLEGHGGGGGGGNSGMGRPPPGPGGRGGMGMAQTGGRFGPRGGPGMGQVPPRPPPGGRGMMGPMMGPMDPAMMGMGGGMPGMMPGAMEQLAAAMMGGMMPGMGAGMAPNAMAGMVPPNMGALQEQQLMAAMTSGNPNLMAEAMALMAAQGRGGPGGGMMGPAGMGPGGMLGGAAMGAGDLVGGGGGGMMNAAMANKAAMMGMGMMPSQPHPPPRRVDSNGGMVQPRRDRSRSRSRSPIRERQVAAPSLRNMTYEEYLEHYSRVQQEVRQANQRGRSPELSPRRQAREVTPSGAYAGQQPRSAGAVAGGGAGSGMGQGKGQPYTEEEYIRVTQAWYTQRGQAPPTEDFIRSYYRQMKAKLAGS